MTSYPTCTSSKIGGFEEFWSFPFGVWKHIRAVGFLDDACTGRSVTADNKDIFVVVLLHVSKSPISNRVVFLGDNVCDWSFCCSLGVTNWNNFPKSRVLDKPMWFGCFSWCLVVSHLTHRKLWLLNTVWLFHGSTARSANTQGLISLFSIKTQGILAFMVLLLKTVCYAAL